MRSLIPRFIQEWLVKRSMHRWILEYKYDIRIFTWRKEPTEFEWEIALRHKTLEECITFMHDINTRFVNNGRLWRIRNGSTGEIIPGEAFV